MELNTLSNTPRERVIVYSKFTFSANAKRFLSPPDIPFTVPGKPMMVFWHFSKPI